MSNGTSHFSIFLRLFRESFLFAFEALRVNKLRTILSLLGITIGIFLIIAVFTATDALENKIKSDIQSLGKNVVYVQKWPWVPEGDGEYPWWKYMNRPVPSYREVIDLRHRTTTDQAMAYAANINGQVVKYKSSSIENINVSCVSEEFDQVRNLDLVDGRFFTDADLAGGRPLAIIGSDVNSALFPANNGLGKEITVHGFKLTIVGVLNKEGTSTFDNSLDNYVLVPMNFARNLVNFHSRDFDPYIIVKAKDGIELEEMKDELRGALRTMHSLKPGESDDFSLNEISLLSGSLEQLFLILGMAGKIIGGFSIFVGGFGTANIMFVSVRERTNIIGIQKSLGAKNYFILLQFLFESIALCLFGGLLGLLLVFVLSVIVSLAAGMSVVLSPGNVVIGLGISATIGILSGIIPAIMAAIMNPVDAIRSN